MTLKKYLDTIEDLSNRKIAVTGATSGIGRELINHLAKKGASIVVLALEDDLAASLKEEFLKIYPNIKFDVVKYDQSSFESIDKTIEELETNHPDINTFVLNAGVLGEKGKTVDGYASTIAINYLNARYFIDNLSKRVNRNIRFVIQGSIVAGLKLKKNIDFHNEKIGFFDQYNISKIYLEAYFHHLVKENKYKNIEYVLTEPGISATNVIRNMNVVIRGLGKVFLKIFFHSPKKASLTLLKGISRETPNGSYIVPRGLFTMSGYPKIKEFQNKRKREYLFIE